MVNKFYNGELAIYIDKTHTDSIKEFCNYLIDNFDINKWPGSECGTLYRYLADLFSGPYHFIDRRRASVGYNGTSSLNWLKDQMNICETVNLDKFLNECNSVNYSISEDELMNIFE